MICVDESKNDSDSNTVDMDIHTMEIAEVNVTDANEGI